MLAADVCPALDRRPGQGGLILVRDIIRATAGVSDLSIQQLLSPDKTKRTVRVRQVGILVSSRLTTNSWPDIGQRWGGRDHTTALHSARRAQERIAAECDIALPVFLDLLADLGVAELPAERPESAHVRPVGRAALELEIRTLEFRLAHARARLAALPGDPQ